MGRLQVLNVASRRSSRRRAWFRMLGRLGSPEWCGARGGAAEVAEGAAAAAGRAGRRPGGAGRAAVRGRSTRVYPHEFASNEECTRTCCCRACWNGTGTARNRASWNGSGRNMHKYAEQYQKYAIICQKYAIICQKYEKNMHNI